MAVKKVGPGDYKPNGSYARVKSAALQERMPDWTAEQVDAEARRLWSLWVENQALPREAGQEEAGQEEAGQEEAGQEAEMREYGFAKTDGKTWFPAWKKTEVMRAGRLQVIFMRTGEALFIPKEDWTPYTAEFALQLVQDKVANRGGFSAALKDMREEMSPETGVQGLPGSSTSSRGVARTIGGELSNQKLGVENRVNAAAFKAKIFIKENGKFGCKNCPSVTLSYESVAKRHARLCGERPSVPRERSSYKKHTCSADDCTASFASQRELHSHYRSAHPDRRPLKCPPCRITFKSSDNLKKHMREKHTAGKKFKCSFCAFTTARSCRLGYHMERWHKDEYDLMKAQDTVDGQEDMVEEDGQENIDIEDDQENIEDGQENKEEDNFQDDDEEMQEEGILGRLQSQIRELKKRHNSLVPWELLQLSNLLKMREVARAAGLGSSSSEEVRGVLGSRGRKRAASPDRVSEPTRQSPRLLATQV